jgi:5-(carboxyamino)imidazole ribonucleotide mutase
MKQVYVSVVMGSLSDFTIVQETTALLEQFNVPYEKKVVSAHRTPLDMVDYATNVASRGIQVVIAAAGGAAHLPGMIASMTTLPVIGIPIESKALKGMDSLLSIVQMPAGVPVLTVAIGVAGAKNAALAAISILAIHNPELATALQAYRDSMASAVRASVL